MSFKLINLKAGTFNIEAFTIGVPIDQFPIEWCGIFTGVFLFACFILLGYITKTNTNDCKWDYWTVDDETWYISYQLLIFINIPRLA